MRLVPLPGFTFEEAGDVGDLMIVRMVLLLSEQQTRFGLEDELPRSFLVAGKGIWVKDLSGLVVDDLGCGGGYSRSADLEGLDFRLELADLLGEDSELDASFLLGRLKGVKTVIDTL